MKLICITVAILLLPIVAISIGLLFGKNIFDNPDFWYGYMSYFGTAILGAIAVWQNINAQKTNERLTKENNNLQKIISQKTLPVVKAESISTRLTLKAVKTSTEKGTFSICTTYTEGKTENTAKKVDVNIDATQDPIFQKSVSFTIKNISDAFVRHIGIDHIEIKGYKESFNSIICQNGIKGGGFSDLLLPNDAVKITITFYTSDKQKVKLWDDKLGGIGFTLYLTNTTINGFQFQEFISIDINNNGYRKVSYGEKTLQGENINNA